jgi:hypothetical protein
MTPSEISAYVNKLLDDPWGATIASDVRELVVKAFIQAVADEREACAKVAEDISKILRNPEVGVGITKAIRERR